MEGRDGNRDERKGVMIEGEGRGNEVGRGGEGGKSLGERVKRNDPGIVRENGSLKEGEGR